MNLSKTSVLLVQPLYNTEEMSDEHVNKAKEFLESQDWSDVTPEKLIMTLEEMVTKFCKLRNPPKKPGMGPNLNVKIKSQELLGNG